MEHAETIQKVRYLAHVGRGSLSRVCGITEYANCAWCKLYGTCRDLAESAVRSAYVVALASVLMRPA
jgi:hypothetical protein